jgi:AraC-like DNA-binding protein
VDALTQPLRPELVDSLLEGVRVRSAVFCRSEMRAPWGFGVEAHGHPSFHVVTRGEAWLDVDGASEPALVGSGDLVVLPGGPRHWMRDRPGSPAPHLESILTATPVGEDGRLRHGGDGARTDLVCGGFTVEGGALDSVAGALPAVIHIRGSGGAPAPWLSASLDLVRAVAASDGPGSEAVLCRLADTVLLQALRSALHEADPARLAAMRDPGIAKAVRLIHSRPDHAWTVAELAAEVSYSRSTFASRFRLAVGESPMGYLRRTRLAHAAALLAGQEATLGEIAIRCGYGSEFSFSRAFKRSFGVAPGAYRAGRQGRAIPVAAGD